MVKDYWRRVARRARQRAVKSLGFDSWGRVLTAILSFVVAAAVLLFWGSQDAAGDMTLERAALWVITLLAFPFAYLWFFIRSPAEMEREAKDNANTQINELTEQVRELEAEQQQLLSFDFRPDDNKFFESVAVTSDLSGNKNAIALTFTTTFHVGRIAVKNLSETESLPEVRTVLIHYRFNDEPFKTLDMRLTSYSSGQQVENVPARQSVTYDLFRVGIFGDNYSLHFGPDKDGQYKPMPFGRYRLKITAASTKLGMQHLPKYFLLDVNEKGEIDYGPADASEPGRIRRTLDLTDLV